MRTKRVSSRWTWGTAAIIVFAVGTVLPRLRPTYSLLQHASSVGIVPNNCMIVWLSDHEFIAGQLLPNHILHGALYDTRTGQQRRVDQTLMEDLLHRSSGENEYVITSLGPEHYVNVNGWDQHKIDAARTHYGTVNLVGKASPPIPLTFRPTVTDTLSGGAKVPPAARSVTLYPDVAFSVALPYQEAWIGFLFSPHKDRWVATIMSHPGSPLPVWLRRFLPRGGKQDIESVYTGRTDGTGTRCLGDVPVSTVRNPAGQVIQYGMFPGSLQWLPDGKHLSFVYNSTIYTLLAE